MIDYKGHYDFADARHVVWRACWLFDQQLAIESYANELDKREDMSDEHKITLLYDFALREFEAQAFNTDERSALLHVVNDIGSMIRRNEFKGDGRDHLPKYGTWENLRHGRKRCCYQHKHRSSRYEWEFYSHKTSKCWKDQRGKGRNKRNTQYRAA